MEHNCKISLLPGALPRVGCLPLVTLSSLTIMFAFRPFGYLWASSGIFLALAFGTNKLKKRNL